VGDNGCHEQVPSPPKSDHLFFLLIHRLVSSTFYFRNSLACASVVWELEALIAAADEELGLADRVVVKYTVAVP
jgi:hypothetical protein